MGITKRTVLAVLVMGSAGCGGGVTTPREPASATPTPGPTPPPPAAESSLPARDDSDSSVPTGPKACEKARFFDFFRNKRLITADSEILAQLQIHFDYHTGAGCMAADGYGTDMIIRLYLRGDEKSCFIDRAEARAVDWGMWMRAEHGVDRKLRFDFEAFDVQQHKSLTDPHTAAVTLHHPQRKLALSVRRNRVLFYEEAEADSVLHTVVDTQGEEEGCCWPTTSTKFRPDY